jgi:fructose-1,6-bisphosphatase II / sedoheptulose-1,7-bisphosphatase
MSKIAIGPGYPPGTVDLDRSATDNIHALAKAKGVEPKDITVLVMDRPRHEALIAEIRGIGCGIRLITDGDIMGVIYTTMPGESGVDLYVGIGAAPEGVIAAGALRCIGGQMQGRLILDTDEKRERALKMGVTDPEKKYELNELARGDVVVAATGVTDGPLLKGVRFKGDTIETETLVWRSTTGTVRRIGAEHRDHAKFHLEA